MRGQRGLPGPNPGVMPSAASLSSSKPPATVGVAGSVDCACATTRRRRDDDDDDEDFVAADKAAADGLVMVFLVDAIVTRRVADGSGCAVAMQDAAISV